MPAPLARDRRAETCRLLLLAAAGCWLLCPFATGRLIGAGDALWYANVLADFVLQWRAGVFPVFAGQTVFAFNGAAYPLRVTPFYQHLAGGLDLLTGHRLGFFALQHLLVIVCGVAGLYGCYFALAALAPRWRWSAAAFAILYLSCPGILGVVYTQDLYMTWTAIPFLPLAVYGLVRTFRRDDLAAQFWLVAPLAALWWCHSPVALWMTALAGLTQVVRLAIAGREAGAWRRAAAGAGVFALLAQYPFLSLHLVHAAGAPSFVTSSLAHDDAITKNVHAVFPAMLLPISHHAAALSDLQLGYSLWAVLFAALVASLTGSGKPEKIALGLLLVCCGLLLILLLPVPEVTDHLWALMPGTVKRITFYWPMQRFYPILAALLAFAGQLACSGWLSSRRQHGLVAAALGLACGWSLWESREFVHAGWARTADQSDSALAQRPENILLMNHSYGLFAALPSYFSNGVMAPGSEARLWSRDLKARSAAPVTQGTAPAAAPTPASVQAGSFHGTIDPNPGILDLSPSLRLEPGKTYALRIAFADHDYRGVLELKGRSVSRQYLLPASGERLAFGSGPTNSNVIPLWSTDPAGDEVTLRFIPTAPGARAGDFADFGQFTLAPIDFDHAPVVITSLLPFRATVRSGADGWLETPRMFMPGYTATVDLRPASVSSSPAGLAMVPVPAGLHRVELRYPGPGLLRLSYWAALAAWTGLLVLAGSRLLARR